MAVFRTQLQILHLVLHPCVPCIFSYAPSHSRLLFIPVLSLWLSRILGQPFGSTLLAIVVEKYICCITEIE